MTFLKKAWAYIAGLPRLYSIGGGIIIIAIVAVGVHALTRGNVTATVPDTTPHVHIASVASLSGNSGTLSTIGKVSSLNQATILAETSGEITTLTGQIGDTVVAGEEIGSFENSSEQASVQQAEGAYQAALASQSATSLPEAMTQARNSYLSAYTTLDGILSGDVDALFGEPTPIGPKLLVDSPDAPKLERERSSIDDLMSAWRDRITSASTTDPAVLLDDASSQTQTVSLFITDLATAAHAYNSGATDDQLTKLNAAQSGTATLLSTISSARTTYRNSSVGATAGASASVQQALGALNGAKAGLEKTIIRSPISGTIVSLPITKGDFVTAFSQVAVVSNPGALEIDAYVTADDAKTLSVGSAAAIASTTKGVIVSIAPALDPTTGKILVKIGLPADQSALTDGDTVTVSLSRSAPVLTTGSDAITIPIAAVKITPTGAAVFTVSSSTLMALPVTLGAVSADQVTIASGITTDTEIVTDARGLSDGESVIVDTP